METRHRQRGIAAVAVTASILTLAACGSDDGSSAGGKDCEVRSLLVGTMTGANSEHGVGEKAGSEAAVKSINDAGGINGCKLVLDIEDDGGDLTQTLPITQAAMQKHDYAHVNVTGYGGSSVLPYLISEDQFAITTLGLADTYNDTSKAKYQFDTINLVADSASVVVSQAVANGDSNIGIVVDNTAVGASVADAAEASINDAGGSVAAKEPVDVTSVDFLPVVQRLKSAGADTVFTDLYGEALGHFIKAVRTAQWDVPMYAGQISYVTDLEPLLDPADYEGIVMGGSAGVTAPTGDATQKVIDEVVAAGDTKLRQHLGGVLWSHDSLTLFAWAANEVGSTDAAKMATFLQDNGDEAVPGLTMAANTGYTSSSHDWKGKDSIALVNATVKDDVGRYTDRIGLFTPPAN